MSALGETLQFLRSKGFKRAASGTGSQRIFEGNLRLSAGEVPVRIEIADWDFLDYPRIEITNPPSFLPSPIPHIDSTGGLCYFAPDSVVLDRFAPASAVALCLEQAQDVLQSLLTNKRQREAEVRDELLAYWAGGVNRSTALIGNIDTKAAVANCFIVEFPKERLEGASIPVISASADEVEMLARSVGGKVLHNKMAPCWIFRTSLPPVAPEGRLPKTISELFGYLRRWDESLYKALQRGLGTDKDYLQFTRTRAAVQTPVGWLGFGFELNPVLRKGFARKPLEYRQYLHKKGADTPISRMSPTQFGTDFIHARNLSVPTLAGKRVNLVGCGSVGGYIAQSLARLGAGSHNGVLRLIDPQLVEAGNVGRHWLGMSSLYLPKAEAVARELRQQFPSSQFVPMVADAREVRGLLDADLTIDATGIEALSEAINAVHCDRDRAKVAPVLHVWVMGNGDAAQGLWVDAAKFGCYRCLRLPRGAQYRQERFPVLTREPERRRTGCSEYRPYAVSAPMNAAAMATEFVVDWLQGNPSPRFRTLIREGADARKQKNQDFEKLKDCPACNQSE